MQNLGFYLTEIPMQKGKFMARTVYNVNLSDTELINEICRSNPSFDPNNVKEVMKQIVNTVRNQISKGNTVSIPNFFKIAPVVKGAFDSSTDSFNRSKHWVGINFTVSSAFVNEFQNAVSVEKTDKPNNWPDIVEICDNKTDQNAIQKDYSNYITGNYFIVNGYEFKGIMITSSADQIQSVFIGTDQIEIMNHTQKELHFILSRAFIPPAWLVNGMDIMIRLKYEAGPGKTIESEQFETNWMC